MHFFAPANLPRVSKMVVFVIDNSYSMVGNKMAQVSYDVCSMRKDCFQFHFVSRPTFAICLCLFSK